MYYKFIIFAGNLATYDETMQMFSNFFMPVSKCGQNGGNDRSQLVVESWNFFGVSMIKQILMYLEIIFGKNKEQTTRQQQFKLDPLLAGSTKFVFFTRGGSKLFTPNHLVNCASNMSQYFRKLIWYNFATNIWQVLHKKTSFWALEKWKMNFPCKDNENSLRQDCLKFQDAPLCTI